MGALLGLVGVTFAWATTFSISGAVIGKGQVQASANRIAVQHPRGGVVAEILATDGDRVKSGDVVLRLENTQLGAELAATESGLFEILANEARLEAELQDRHEVEPQPILQEAIRKNPELQDMLQQQQDQLDAHYESVATQVSLLEEETQQIDEQAIGEQATLDAKVEELALLENELAVATESLSNGLITKTVVTTFQQEVIAAKGEIGRLMSKVAELKGMVSGQQLKLNAVPLDAKKLSADQLNLLRQQSAKLIEDRNAILSSISQLDVRTPVSGMVFDSQVLGPRSIVEAAKPIMYIVPDDQPMLIVVRVEAIDIDQVEIGQRSALRFTTFNRRATPMIDGTVTAISADAFTDERTQGFYYYVDVALVEEELVKLGDVSLISGMPVEAFLTTESRSPASYVVKPIVDYFAKAFRD
ncbi:MAG: HlyD family type I secretion periplasmic adaptor subunit [Candidatus Devosia phytovorans]|uniref:Membrane fusion protein (MFP) family protein n=1 Tax=Candidatus Devosia phytovorans TaxID=3121372 RepID=A0AAJ5VVW4_9HYPH|nr:HlyD family type I secretion periplasmic adaptor subunit [Devosia sp.]WEK04369.1 MAG: HlyD family type I secretion periplasmic adaptor subunit [Devosia sp.]